MKFQMPIALMILLTFLVTCKTTPIILEPLVNYTKEYNKCETEKDILKVNAVQIIDLRAKIFKLWISIIKADKQTIKVIDIRDKKSLEKFKEYIKSYE
jgi:hypothetical protein